jgi:hypothetical protein
MHHLRTLPTRPSLDAGLQPWSRIVSQNKPLFFITYLVCGIVATISGLWQKNPKTLAQVRALLVSSHGCPYLLLQKEVRFWYWPQPHPCFRILDPELLNSLCIQTNRIFDLSSTIVRAIAVMVSNNLLSIPERLHPQIHLYLLAEHMIAQLQC